jgi:phosphatidylinositol glycan class B
VSRRQWLLLGVILLVGVAVRLAYAWGADGTFHPDDIHQSLEPAHGLVYGTGLRFWEFEAGARPWTVPGVFVLLLGLLKLLGVTSPEGYTLVARLVAALVTATWPWLCFRLGRALHSPRAGLAAAWLCATWYVLVLLAPRAFGHTFSVTFALWACARVAECPPAPPGPPALIDAAIRRHHLVTGLLLGLAFAFRYQEGLVAAGLALYLVATRRARAVVWLAVGTAVPALAVGLLDWATWGLPFHSLFAYLHTNVGQDVASVFGRMPWHFYCVRLLVLLGPAAALLLFLPLARRPALLLAATVAGLVLVAHSVIGHKELRFVLVAVLLLFTAAACGVAEALERLARVASARGVAVLAATLLVAWGAASAQRASAVTFADFGLYAGLPEERASPWAFRRDCNRALARVGRRPDLCAVAVFPFGEAAGGHRIGSTGGYTYLNRGVPLVVGRPSPAAFPLVNYVIACPGVDTPARGFGDLQVAEQVGECTVYRRPGATECDPAAVARLERQWRRQGRRSR